MNEQVNLVPAIEELEKVIRGIKGEYEKKLKPYKNSLEQLRKLNTVCEHCKGMGKINIYAEDQWGDPSSRIIDCPDCHGTGQSKNGGNK